MRWRTLFLWPQILTKPFLRIIIIVDTEKEVIEMKGRPKKEITRDIMYKVRLNAEEDQMLTRASKWTEQAKSEVFRKALLGYYKTVEVKEHIRNKNIEDAGWQTDQISQQRLIKCPYSDCSEEFVVDFADYSEEQRSEGSMGERCEHIFDTNDIECPECRRNLHAVGIISEYPIGAYEYERITIEEDER